MLRKHTLSWIALVALLATVLAACGGSQQPTTGTGGGTGSGEQQSVTIRWRTRPGDAAEQRVYEELNALVNEKLKDKGITAVYDPAPRACYEL